MSNKILKVGLIGLGRMGQNHLRILSMLKGVELVFIADANARLAAKLGDGLEIPGVGHPDHLFAAVDAVVICTPTVTHADYIMRAAPHVQNIFVEKPLANTLAEAEQLTEFVQKEQLNLQVGFIERFNPAVQCLKNVLHKSERVISIDFTRTNKLSARITDVDVVTDLMIHDIDLALYLSGPVQSVAAHGVAQGQMIDFASALLTHQNGRFSRIQASRITEKKIRTIQATCSDMYVDCELLRKELLINRQSEIQQQDSGPYSISAIEQTIEVRQQEALLSELQAFVAGCNGLHKPETAMEIPTAADGLQAAYICDQIQQAVRQ